MKYLGLVTMILLIVGGLNWGLVGFFHYDLVKSLFGATFLSQLVYILVGLSAIYQLIAGKVFRL